MALIVEDGTGLENAEAYASVDEVTTYLTKFGDETAWLALPSDTVREQHLRKATRYLDQKYNNKWKGQRVDKDQSLDWPREDVEDRDGFFIDGDIVPLRLKDASAFLSNRSLTETLLPDLDTPGDIKSTRVKVGSLESATVYAGSNSQKKVFQVVEGLLRDLLVPSSELRRS